METSLPRLRSRLAYMNVPENTETALCKIQTVALIPKKQTENKIMNNPAFLFTFSPALFNSINSSRHQNQILHCPDFPYHTDHKLYCLHLGKF